MSKPILYALDFDGVLCDSAIETALSGWKAACQIWPEMPENTPPHLLQAFRQVRPIIETGYEAILTMRLLHLGVAVEQIASEHSQLFADLIQQTSFDSEYLKALFGETRDRWIAAERADWIGQNPLYAGVASKLQALGEHNWYVITTKQERFVKQIFAANAIELAEERIFGLDRQLSKVEVLKMLRQKHPTQAIHFVEDRLPTLLKVAKVGELADVELLFALWGYNTERDKISAREHGFRSLQLTDFLIDRDLSRPS